MYFARPINRYQRISTCVVVILSLSFISAGLLIARHVTAASGDLDTNFAPSLAGSPLQIEAIALQPDGKILIGGHFESVNGVPRLGLARLHTDGTLDTGFVPPLVTPSIHAIHVEPDGQILVGGNFFISTGRRFLVRLEADGTLESEFNELNSPNFDTSSNLVLSITHESGGSFLIGGRF